MDLTTSISKEIQNLVDYVNGSDFNYNDGFRGRYASIWFIMDFLKRYHYVSEEIFEKFLYAIELVAEEAKDKHNEMLREVYKKWGFQTEGKEESYYV